MKVLKNISIVLLALTLFSCNEVLAPLFDAGEYAFVGFSSTDYTIAENSSDTLNIPVSVAGVAGADVEITFADSIIDAKSAVKDVDYRILNTGNKVVVKGGVGVGYIQIVPINNNLYTKDKTFTITLTSNTAGYYIATDEKTVTVKISDDEHPLAIVLGSYGEVDYLYTGGAAENSTPYDVTISPIEGSETSVSINNFWGGGDYNIIADVDVANKTFNIRAGQIIYVYSDYGDCKAVAIISGAYDTSAAISGTFDNSGNITTGSWAARVSAGSTGKYLKAVLTKK